MSEGKWTASTDEEYWTDIEEWDSKDDAIEAAPDYLELDPGETFYVGQKRAPVIHIPAAADIIDHILDHEDFGVECAEDSFMCTKEQRDELTADLKKTFTDWMNRHGLTPSFFLIQNATKHICPANPVPETTDR